MKNSFSCLISLIKCMAGFSGFYGVCRFEDAMILVLPLALMSVEIKAGIVTGTSGSPVRRATDRASRPGSHYHQ